jgi:hypothetical protein
MIYIVGMFLMLLRRQDRRMRVKVKCAVATALLCTLVITPFMATQTKAFTQTTIPVGQYTTLSEIPVPPPTPIPVGGSYNILFYNVTWEVDGRVSGGPIDIYVFNDSNYQDFKGNQQYSMFQQLLSISGPFNVDVVFPSNDPNGRFVFQGYNVTWWIVFDNRAGSSNATLYIDTNENKGSYEFVWSGDGGASALAAAGVIAAVLLVIGAALLKKRHVVHA